MLCLKSNRTGPGIRTAKDLAGKLNLSTVHRGVLFEQRALKLLRDEFSMSLTRVGGRGDGGIDLIGWWWLPYAAPCLSPSSNTPSSSPDTCSERRRRIRIVGQCKAEKKKMGPNYVRELEGVMYRLAASAAGLRRDIGGHDESMDESVASIDLHSTREICSPPSSLSMSPRGTQSLLEDGPRDEIPTVAVLVSQSPFTRATILAVQSSSIPFLLVHLPTTSTPDSLNVPLTDQTPKGVAEMDDCGSTRPASGTQATVIFNQALGGTQGLLGGQMEVRWERDLSVGGGLGKPGLWWLGRKLRSWTPQAV